MQAQDEARGHAMPVQWRVARVVALVIALWVAVSAYSTQYAPIVDCYPQAVWNGRAYIPTGEWICLK